MSVGISIQFLTGRYHATPWNHQVNEGVVEWPPSPWRILRALVSAYYRLPQTPTRTDLCELLICLANSLPCYIVPEHTTGHTRHYMPVWKEGEAKTTKVFDTFIVLPRGALSAEAVVKIIWTDVQLNELQLALLRKLCYQISYLGRSESWTEIQVINDSAIKDNFKEQYNIVPIKLEEQLKLQQKHIKVLVPLTSQELEGFKTAISILPKPKKGKIKWKAPADILEALELDIGELHRECWNGIPGSRWETYTIKSQFEKIHLKRNFSNDINLNLPTFARFALASNVLPNLTEAIHIGERFRQALMAWSKDDFQKPATVFSGKKFDTTIDSTNNEESYLNGQQHAWYLPEINQQGKIDHIVVYATAGFDSQQAIPALKNLTKVWGNEGFDIQTILVSLGQVEDYAVELKQHSVIGNSQKWRSLTPMLLPRYPKCYRNGEKKFISNTEFQVDGPEDQALRLLVHLKYLCIPDKYTKEAENEWLCLKAPDNKLLVKVRCCDTGVTQYRWTAFKRNRHHGNGLKSLDTGHWLEIEFAEPRYGPIALGYAAHFGLGIFVPEEN